jgi:hypothetical protein
MGRLIDLDDLVDASEVAAEMGLASRKALAAVLSKPVGAWKDFPAPVIDRPPSRFWLRPEVQAWDERHPERRRRGRPTRPPAER